MKLKAKERLTGSYGTVNAGDVINVSDETGNALIEAGLAEKTTSDPDMATPQEVSQRNVSGLKSEPVKADGTIREELNTDGRKLHETPGDMVTDEQVKIEDAATDGEKEEKTAVKRQTKEDKTVAVKNDK